MNGTSWHHTFELCLLLKLERETVGFQLYQQTLTKVMAKYINKVIPKLGSAVDLVLLFVFLW